MFKASPRSNPKHALFAPFVISLFLLGTAVVFAFPFFWMVFASFKENREIFTPFPLLPTSFNGSYYGELLSGKWIPFLQQYFNTVIIATAQTFGALLISIPMGFLITQYTFRGAKFLFLAVVLVILIPRQVMILPLLEWVHLLNIYDHPLAVILPGTVAGLGILYFALVYKRYPSELLDLARTEGAGEYRVFLSTLPLIKPAILTYGLIHFIFAWHEHLLPLALLSTPEKWTVTLGLGGLYGNSMRMPFALLMVGSTFVVLPTAILFLLLKKHFKSSLSDLMSQ